jgi:hypothetical protein
MMTSGQTPMEMEESVVAVDAPPDFSGSHPTLHIVPILPGGSTLLNCLGLSRPQDLPTAISTVWTSAEAIRAAAAIAPGPETGSKAADQVEKFARAALDGASSRKLRSQSVAAEQLGIAPNSMPRLESRLAASLLQLKRAEVFEVQEVLRALTQRFPDRLQLVAEMGFRDYDETPTRLRVGDEGGRIAKVLQCRVSWGCLLKVTLSGEGQPTYLFFHGKVWCSLTAVDRNTAECTQAVMERQCPSLHRFVAPRKIHVVCTDDAGSNSRAEFAILAEATRDESQRRESTLHFACAVHKAQEVIKHPMDIFSDTVSGLLGLALSTRGAGVMARIRRILKDVISDRLDVRQGRPPEAANLRRAMLLGVYCARGGRKRKQVSVAMKVLANGDWADTESVQHYCSPLCCPGGRQQTLSRFFQHIVPALAGASFAAFARNRWNSCYVAMDQQGLFESVHGLLSAVYVRWAREQAADDDPDEAASQMHPPPHRGLPALHGDAGVSDSHARAGDCNPVAADREQAGGEGPGVPAPEPTEVDAAALWRAAQNNVRSQALKYILPAANPCDRLVALRVVAEPQSRLMDSLLHMSSKAWELKQLKSLIDTGERQYRVIELAKQVLVDRCIMQVNGLITTGMWALTKRGLTVGFRGLLFRLVARMGACALHFLKIPHQAAHYRIFLLLESQEGARDLLATRKCLLDDFVKGHLAQFPSEEELVSGDSLGILKVIAERATVDIARLECGHAHLRRVREVGSVQTHLMSLSKLSSAFLQHQCRVDSKLSPLPESHIGEPAASTADEPKPRRGGGGAWRAFVHEQAQGAGGLKDMRVLQARYRDLPPEERARYIEIGQAGTAAFRAGASRAFPLSERQLASASRGSASASTDRHPTPDESVVATRVLRSGQADEYFLLQTLKVTRDQEREKGNKSAQDEEAAVLALRKYGHTHLQDNLRPLLELVPALGDVAAQHLSAWPHTTKAIAVHNSTLQDQAVSALKYISARRPHGLGPTLDKWFEDEHDIILHDKCRPIVTKERRRVCLRLGCCVCSEPGISLQRMCTRLIQKLKKLLPKEDGSRALLRGGSVVIRFGFATTSDNPSDLVPQVLNSRWCSVPFLQLSPFSLVFLELENPRPSPSLQGHIDLDCKFDENSVAAWTTGHRFFQTRDLAESCSCEVYTLVSEENSQPIPTMELSLVQVEKLDKEGSEFQIWGGSSAESRGTKRGRGQGKGRQGRPGFRSQPTSSTEPASAPVPMVGDEDDAADALSRDDDSEGQASAGSEVMHVSDYNEMDAFDLSLEAMGTMPTSSALGEDMGEMGLDVADVLAHGGGDGGTSPMVYEPESPRPASEGGCSGSDVGAVADTEQHPPELDIAVDVSETAPAPSDSQGELARFPAMRVLVDVAAGHSLRYDIHSGQLIAYCGLHGAKCRLQRTTKSSAKAGSGRPIGFLVAWLGAAVNHSSRDEHFADREFSHEDRSIARDAFADIPGSPALLALESPLTETLWLEPEVFNPR